MTLSALHTDLGSPDAYIHGVPHEVFADLRRHEPVAWIEEPAGEGFAGGPGFWAVTRYDDVMTVSKNPDIFSSHKGASFLRDQRPQDLAALQQMMLNLDPPDHSQMRSIVSKVFTPKMVRGMLDSIADHARAIVDALPDDGEIDLVEHVSAEMPLRVLADVLGVPSEDRHLLYDWTNRMVGLDDPSYGGREAFLSAFIEMFKYSNAHTKAKRAEPGSDVWSLIVNAEVDGARLSTEELNRFFQLLVIAGNETTRNLLTGFVLTLSEHPDERSKLATDPALLPKAIEEVLRFHSPVMQFRRTVTRETELGGKQLHEGQKVVMFYVSANRDEAQFDDPDTFRIDRGAANHLAFGAGTHFCLGNSLARLEAKVLLETLFARFPHWQVTGPPDRFRSNFINGIKKLPVHLGKATS
ncbi:cytochrome P450 [Rhodococcus sp. IEGM 1305]|jgi:cytochrome P450|uniref:cytochrome P450 n=1 Tax=Rhodococcus sp. IEGM 1305 TaxID=3047092 RepID=UPI0024B682F0|nr:cytochrome P450 [Rhodococcus sp. IEGM 1305]MDI9951405.1 cytochrome P450 [Rhodococcus sp. IEGM 1305]